MKTVQNMKKISSRSGIPLFLKEHGLNKRICEVGVRFGYNFEQLLRTEPEMLVGVDHYAVTSNPAQQDTGLSQGALNRIYGDAFKRFLHEPNVKIFRGQSGDAVKVFPDYFFDYVYVDADHSYEGALCDIRKWYPKVRQGGILAGHDYVDIKSKNGVDFGVIRAVAEFLDKEKIPIDREFFHVTSYGTYRSWMIYKEEGE